MGESEEEGRNNNESEEKGFHCGFCIAQRVYELDYVGVFDL